MFDRRPSAPLSLSSLLLLLLPLCPTFARGPRLPEAKPRVYCAGPMDNAQDFADQRALAKALREGGYSVYLPVDDGFSLILMYDALAKSGRSAVEQEEARYWLMVAVYTLDMYQLLDACDAAVANVNPFDGKVNPDAGTVVEVAVAAAYGVPVAFFKTAEPRLLPPGTRKGTGWDNPMVVGLSGDFSLRPGYAADTAEGLVRNLGKVCESAGRIVPEGKGQRFERATPIHRMPKAVREAIALGAKVAAMKEKYRGLTFDETMALRQVDEVVALMRAEAKRHGVAPFTPLP